MGTGLRQLMNTTFYEFLPINLEHILLFPYVRKAELRVRSCALYVFFLFDVIILLTVICSDDRSANNWLLRLETQTEPIAVVYLCQGSWNVLGMLCLLQHHDHLSWRFKDVDC